MPEPDDDIFDELERRYDRPPTLWERLTVPIRDWFTFRRYGRPDGRP